MDCLTSSSRSSRVRVTCITPCHSEPRDMLGSESPSKVKFFLISASPLCEVGVRESTPMGESPPTSLEASSSSQLLISGAISPASIIRSADSIETRFDATFCWKIS